MSVILWPELTFARSRHLWRQARCSEPLAGTESARSPRRCCGAEVVSTFLAGGPACACGVVASSLAFGSVDPLANGNTNSSSSITVTCQAPAAYAVAINHGQTGTLQRRMVSGASALAYQLYTDANRATIGATAPAAA